MTAATRLSAEAIQALWVIDHKATFCAGIPGASEPPKMKFSDLPREAAVELRAAKVLALTAVLVWLAYFGALSHG